MGWLWNKHINKVFSTHRVLISQGFVILMVCSGVKIKVNLLWLSTSGQQSGSLPFESIVFQIFAETVLRHYQRMMNTVLKCTFDKLVPFNYHPHKTIKPWEASSLPFQPLFLILATCEYCSSLPESFSSRNSPNKGAAPRVGTSGFHQILLF